MNPLDAHARNLKAPTELISGETIAKRVDELAKKIDEDFKDCGSIAFIAVACGAVVFAADLMRKISAPMTVDVIYAKSYQGTTSSGEVVSQVNVRNSLKGRRVLLVDDILDSGRTLDKLLKDLRPFEPASIRTCVLLDKPSRRAVPMKADYVGFEIPDLFVVGYGLDLDGYYRNLPFIGSL